MSSGSSGRHAGNRAGDEKRTWNVTRATKKAILRENARPTLWKDARETDSRRRRNRRGTPGGGSDRGVGHGGKWIIPTWTDRGEQGQLPGRHGIRGVHLGRTDVEEMGSRGGRANQVLGAAVFGRRTSARVPWQGTTYRDSRNAGRRVELHSGGNRGR